MRSRSASTAKGLNPGQRETLSFSLFVGSVIVFLAMGYLYTTQYNVTRIDMDEPPMPVDTEVPIPLVPRSIERHALSRFDDMVKSGHIQYTPSEPELYNDTGLMFEFRTVPMLTEQPLTMSTEPGKTEPQPHELSKPSPDEVLVDVGPKHRLLLNRHSIYRPSLILATKEWASGTDDLDVDDILAAWAIVRSFKTPQVALYNCGVNAGSSEKSHKHLQIIPMPDHKLWPWDADSYFELETRIPGVPFKHWAIRTDRHADASGITKGHDRGVAEAKKNLVRAGLPIAYNVAISSDWIVVIPRSRDGAEGPYGGNAAGMLGMVAVPSFEARDYWNQLHHKQYLEMLGLAFD